MTVRLSGSDTIEDVSIIKARNGMCHNEPILKQRLKDVQFRTSLSIISVQLLCRIHEPSK